MNMYKDTTFNLEDYVKASYNYLNKMVDRNGQPYFNIFWTKPAEAAHDWPDFGDVMSRQLQSAVFARYMTGDYVENENIWYDKILTYIDNKTGLLYRPETQYSKYQADLGDQALTLYALLTVYVDNKSKHLEGIICKMIGAVAEIIDKTDPPEISWLHGFIIKSLMACYRYLEYEPALKLAKKTTYLVLERGDILTPENTLRQGSHMHGTLRFLLGAADYALYAGDPVLYSRIEAVFRFINENVSKFGFMPEVFGRKDDIICCETCALMDYIGLGTTLANYGHPEYWGPIERIVRNHLVESQLRDGSWLESDEDKTEGTRQFSWNSIGDRMLGGYAGWSSPNHILGCEETLNDKWGGSELRDKVRAFQNCCGGSGVHAFFIAWKNACRYHDNCLSINLHIDKLIPEAEIRCFQPYTGLLTINLKKSCCVKIRIPDFVAPSDLVVKANGKCISYKTQGIFALLESRNSGDYIEIKYPLPITEEDVIVGNAGFREYKYKVTWKGDTVVRMLPVGEEYNTAYSACEKKEVAVYYGKNGPGLLYQRDYMLKDTKPQLSKLTMDKGIFDFWFF